MEYKINLGAWNSVFAVPTEIVDKHIKLAGAAQLKVLLWFLRYAGNSFTVDDIASALSMQSADVRDCFQYWIQTGVISINDGIMTPPQSNIEPVQKNRNPQIQLERQQRTQQNIQPSMQNIQMQNIPLSAKNSQTQPLIQKSNMPVSQQNEKRLLSRPEKPDRRYISQRISQDEKIKYLMRTAEEIFSRPVSPNEEATLLLIHEDDGLPVEVIIMMLQYTTEVGKCNMRYIEKMAIEWSDHGINTLELAERKIKELTDGRSATKKIQRLFGLSEHMPTEKEVEMALRWTEKWKFPDEVIKYAYEICVNAKGNYIPNYVNRILEKWFKGGVTTLEKAKIFQASRAKQQITSNSAAYDISAYESTSVADEED